MGDLSKHFSAWEFECNHCDASVNIDRRLLTVLDAMRDHTGRPLTIVSGYRCPEYNARVGGLVGSQHIRGRAADIPRGLFRAGTALHFGAIGVGVRDGWVIHVDMTPGRRPFIFNE